MPERHVAVVGAGMGGLVAALVLAQRGLRVTLLDAADGPGGKLRPVQLLGHALDAGPTVFTMRWVFDDLLAELGLPADVLPPLEPLSVLARHAWAADGSTLDLLADRAASAEAIARFASPAEARRFLAFCDEAGRVYRTLEGPHIRSTRPSLPRMVAELGLHGLATLSGLGPFATLAGTLARRLHDPRLQQLFGRYATYCGSSPWAAPATLMLVAHVEQQGVWAVRGGMMALAEALAAQAARAGVALRWGARCVALETGGSGVRAVRLASGERLPVDAVVFNGDVAALPALLGEPPVPLAPSALRRRSLSAVTWAALARPSGFALARHNVFFDSDYASEFDDVFQRRTLPERGTAYLCAQDRLDDGAPAGGGPERLLLLVNAPADGDRRRFEDAEVDACETRALQLMQRCGLSLELRPSQRVRRTPQDFERLFPATGGALYGAASDGWMAVFRRPGAATAVPGLYLAGGSAHPGPGVPMAAMSGRLAAATLMDDLASTRRSHPVRISGGTSMRSATTAGMP